MKVLLVQNSASDARAVTRLLEESGPARVEFVHVPRVSDALKRLRGEIFDAVLIDPGPRDARGVENIRRVQESMSDLPVVVFGGHHDADRGLAHGGGPEPNAANRIDGAMLMEALRRAIERKQAEHDAEFLAYHDSLTGLPNRRLLLDRLGQAILRTKRANRLLALLFLDLDDFKAINDTLGHDAGDQLLRCVAERLSKRIRASDTLARLGGDEFTVVLPEISGVAEASRFACKLQAALKAPFVIGEREWSISVSIGISLFPHHGENAQALLRSADEAMYQAKRHRGSVCHFDSARLQTPSPVPHGAAVAPVPVLRAGAADLLREPGADPATGIAPRVARAGRSSAARDQELRAEVESVIAALRRRAGGASDPANARLKMADRLMRALEQWGRAVETA